MEDGEIMMDSGGEIYATSEERKFLCKRIHI